MRQLPIASGAGHWPLAIDSGEVLASKALEWEDCFKGSAGSSKCETEFAVTAAGHGSAYKYCPVWDVRRDAITTYRCISQPRHDARADPGSKGDSGEALLRGLGRLAEGLRVLARHLASGERFLMWIPIEYPLLASVASRRDIIQACRAISGNLRPYLILEIGDVPPGLPPGRLADLAGLLRPFCRGVAALLPALPVHDDDCPGAGLHAIGISLMQIKARGPEIGHILLQLRRVAKGPHMKSFVLDVEQYDSLTVAREMGMDLLSGSLIGPAMEIPAPVMHLPGVNRVLGGSANAVNAAVLVQRGV